MAVAKVLGMSSSNPSGAGICSLWPNCASWCFGSSACRTKLHRCHVAGGIGQCPGDRMDTDSARLRTKIRRLGVRHSEQVHA